MKNIVAVITAAAALCTSGCSSTNHNQAIHSFSGQGAKVKVAVPTGNSTSIGLDIFFGAFNDTEVLQPVYTNQAYAPAALVLVGTKGKQAANGSSTGTNAPAASGNMGTRDVSLIATGPEAVTDGMTNELLNVQGK